MSEYQKIKIRELSAEVVNLRQRLAAAESQLTYQIDTIRKLNAHNEQQAAEMDDVRERLAAAESRLADIDNAIRCACEEGCGDEQHCACVPLLRAQVAELQDTIRTYPDSHICPACGGPCIGCECQRKSIKQLRAEIIRLRALCEPVDQTPEEAAFWERVEGAES